jgi:hypothetical protein
LKRESRRIENGPCHFCINCWISSFTFGCMGISRHGLQNHDDQRLASKWTTFCVFHILHHSAMGRRTGICNDPEMKFR